MSNTQWILECTTLGGLQLLLRFTSFWSLRPRSSEVNPGQKCPNLHRLVRAVVKASMFKFPLSHYVLGQHVYSDNTQLGSGVLKASDVTISASHSIF